MIIHVRTAHRSCQAQIVAQDTEQKHGKQFFLLLTYTVAFSPSALIKCSICPYGSRKRITAYDT